MGFTVSKDVCIGSLYAVLVSVFILRMGRRFGARQDLERVVEPAQDGDIVRDESTLEPKHKVFLSHSGTQKNFVEQLCVDLERCDRYPFFDRRSSSLPIGRNFPKLIFEAIEQCEVGVVVLSEEFFTLSKWPMLELVAMTKNAKLVIIPVFLGMTLEQYRDPKREKRWVSIWHGWVRQEKRRGRKIDIKEWCGALRALGPLNSLIYDGGSEVSFRNRIVEAVCDEVLPEARQNDSHVHGRSRLCKVVCQKIDEAKVSQKYGVPVVGLYGVGGIGKTTICQALCNIYYGRMQGRVFHAELGGASDMELLQGALKSLTDKSHDYMCGLGKSPCEDLLKREMLKQPIFLAIDNMTDTTKFIAQAKYFLDAGFNKESIVVVTARSLEVLMLCQLNDSNCLEMPELVEDEAKSLFMKHAMCGHEVGVEIDEEIIASCLKRCHLEKGDGKSYHYHPLALKVLGTQLGCNKYDRNEWANTLNDGDTFNQLREKEHPIFSILRKSFDISISAEDQMLFMDVALFLPEQSWIKTDMTWFDWLSMVHNTSVVDIMNRLEGLKRKSLLQELGEGRSTNIGMHDLWRELAVMEAKAGEIEGRRWVYEVGSRSGLEEGSPSGGFWQKMKRMCFLRKGLGIANRINFDHFHNITVMKIGCDVFPQPYVYLNVDIQKLKHLKSMEFFAVHGTVVGLGLMEKLCFLKLSEMFLSNAVADGIGHLTNLRVLVLVDIKLDRKLNVRNLISLEELHFNYCFGVATISGFSSRLSKLRILNLTECPEVRRLDLGVGDLVALHELCLSGCPKLEELPNLRKLTSLRTLNINGCSGIKAVPGLDNLVALEQLVASDCTGIVELPNLQKLTSLLTLKVNGCSQVTSVPGLDNLVALEELDASSCIGIEELPNIQKLTNLRTLDVSECNRIRSLPGLSELVALRQLRARGCSGLANLPDMRKLRNLQVLDLWGCPLESAPGMGVLCALQKLFGNFRQLPQHPDLSRYSLLRDLEIMGYRAQGVVVNSFVSLSVLVKLKLRDCTLGDEMAGCQSLSRLKVVEIDDCDFKDVSGLGTCTALETLMITRCRWLERLPDLHKLSRLESLSLEECEMLRGEDGCGPCCKGLKFDQSDGDSMSLALCGVGSYADVHCLGSLSQLKSVTCRELPLLTDLPDLRYFPQLQEFVLGGCAELVRLECTGPLVALNGLTVTDCRNLISVLDLSHFPTLLRLHVDACDSLMELTCTGTLNSLGTIKLTCCRGLKAVSNLSNFPELRILEIENCESLMELSCTGALTSLQTIKFTCCRGLKAIPDLNNFHGLKILHLIGGEGIVELKCSSKPLVALEELNLGGCRSLDELPDLSGCLLLKVLRLGGCESLMKLTCISPLVFLKELDLGGCSSLNEIPNLVKDFSQLKVLRLCGWRNIEQLSLVGSWTSLEELDLSGCKCSIVTLDLSTFSELKVLRLSGWESLEELLCTGPLVALKELDVSGCKSLIKMPDLSNFLKLEVLRLRGSGVELARVQTGVL